MTKDEPVEESDDWWKKLIREVEERRQTNRLRLENPYVKDLIEVLMPYPHGLARQTVLHILEKKRKDAGLPIPPKFEQSVQSAYNHHSVDSSVFVRRKAPQSDGLFFSPKGKGSGMWAVHRDRVGAWLEAKLDKVT